MPALLRLDAFAARVEDAFGELPFLVGSATRTKQWRDVDVRLILDDDIFDTMFGGEMKPPRMNLRWALICDALSELARQQTGLPVDFQIQRQTEANEQYGGEARHVLGLRLTGQPWSAPESPAGGRTAVTADTEAHGEAGETQEAGE
jgi:hypothetical protein